jgi:predicted nucleic acid-binding protein
MSGKSFVDTNILLYSYDVNAGGKRDIAKRVLRGLWEDRTGTLSAQVLQEFYVNSTRKMPKPLTPAQAQMVAEEYLPWCVSPSLLDVTAAMRIAQENMLDYWDALLVAAAARSGAERLLTEDLNHNQRVAGVLIVNPFLK